MGELECILELSCSGGFRESGELGSTGGRLISRWLMDDGADLMYSYTITGLGGPIMASFVAW